MYITFGGEVRKPDWMLSMAVDGTREGGAGTARWWGQAKGASPRVVGEETATQFSVSKQTIHTHFSSSLRAF
jgi:hypothetical protein